MAYRMSEAERQQVVTDELQRLAARKPKHYWGNAVRLMKHIIERDGDYDGCLVYLFPAYYHADGAVMAKLDTTEIIEVSFADITRSVIYEHAARVTEYWESYYQSTR